VGTPTSGYNAAQAGKAVVTTAGTPVSLGTQVLGSGVTVMAPAGNNKNVYVFPAGGSKNNVPPLAPGMSMSWPVSNLSALQVDADTSGNSVYWWGAV
jgi:hypothetical protein